MSTLVDAHFGARTTRAEEQAMREHLPTCTDCREYYERHLLLAELDPQAPGAAERLARGLGLRVARRRRLVLPLGLVATAAAAAALLVWTSHHGQSGFYARGGAAPPPPGASLRVYRVSPGQSPRPVGTEIGAHDELAFAYRNPAARARLLIFGVDEHGHVYWYQPAWTDARTNPRAVPIAAGPALHEVPEAVSHQIDGDTLHVFAVFGDRELSVREVEDLIRRQGPSRGPLPLAGVEQRILPLRVRR